MKIVCQKGTEIRKMIELIGMMLENDSVDYPILKEDLVLDISLRDADGRDCPKNNESVCFDESDISLSGNSTFESYYNTDALTKLYNRGKYERDIARLQAEKPDNIICVYIDAIGLHEINNHLGHAAGDDMLRAIAEGLRRNFADCSAYRIGGDEFVVFCSGMSDEQVKQAVFAVKSFLKYQSYEISVGTAASCEKIPLMEAIDRAECAMRSDKQRFYHRNGRERQIRGLNHKLEEILLEKRDASQFLNVIAPEYKGVYMVNPEKDRCRYIYIPDYFDKLLHKTGGVFSEAIRLYCDTFVCEEDKESFSSVFDYKSVLAQIRQGNQFGFDYTKKDGGKIKLQITVYDPNSLDCNEMLWIFMDGDRI